MSVLEIDKYVRHLWARLLVRYLAMKEVLRPGGGIFGGATHLLR